MTGNPILLLMILWPLICSFIGFRIGKTNKRRRDYFSMLVALVELFAALWLFVQAAGGGFSQAPWGGLSLRAGSFTWLTLLDRGITLKIDGFRAIYCVIAGVMWFLTMLISREYFHHYRNRNRYHMFTLMTLSATVGVFLSADFYTTFIFFEIMSFTSFVMVINNEKPASLDAAKLYIAVAVIGGLVMLMGIQMLENIAGTVNFDQLLEIYGQGGDRSALLLPACLMLFGFGAKAGMFPLHVWLPAAHPAAPAPASALLSGILTKSGIFGILIIGTCLFSHDASWGHIVLILGTITMFLGAFLAVFTMDLKRALACSSISQIGFILVGAGMQGLLGGHNALAVRGTLLHMVNHSLIKLSLFMAAGALFMNIHELSLDKIKGFGRGKPALHAAFLVGALSIMGIPGFSGYISKTLLHESIVEYIHLLSGAGQNPILYQGIEALFLFTGGMTVAYMLKIYLAIFWERNPRQTEFDALNKTYLRKKGAAALYIAAAILLVLGFLPYQTMDKLADIGQGFMNGHDPAHAVHYFAWVNLKGAAISISIGLALYFLCIRPCLTKSEGSGKEKRRRYLDRWPVWLDLNKRVYQPLLLVALPAVGGGLARTLYRISEGGFELLGRDLLRCGGKAAQSFYDLADNVLDRFCSGAVEAGGQAAERMQSRSDQGFNRFWRAAISVGSRAAGAVFNLADRGIERVIHFATWLIYKVFNLSGEKGEKGREWAAKKLKEEEGLTYPVEPKDKERERAIWQAINGSLSYSLLLFGVGLIIAMVYLIVIN